MTRSLKTTCILAGGLALLVLLTGPHDVRAQDPKTAEPVKEKTMKKADAPANDSKKDKTLWEMVKSSGWMTIAFLGVIGLGSVYAGMVIFERLATLTAEKMMPSGFVTALANLVKRGEIKPRPYQDLCEQYPSPLSNVLKAGLHRAGKPNAEVEKGMEDAIARESAILKRKIRPLVELYYVGPLVGLLGTVIGIIVAFQAYKSGGGSSLKQSEEFASGISTALQATAGGLFLAIFTSVFSAWFNVRGEKFLEQFDEHLIPAVGCIANMEVVYTLPVAPTAAPAAPAPVPGSPQLVSASN